jgi:hypothetical protein
MGEPLDDLFTKEAAVSPQSLTSKVVGTLTGTVIPGVATVAGARQLMGDKPSAPSIEQEALESLYDPTHEAEMRSIKIEAMLNDFMSSDPVISTYDPDEVLGAYNQVIQLTPRAAIQPAVMRGLLRKMLAQQDAMEPFEAEQLVKVEQGIKKVEEPERMPMISAPAGRREET